MASYREVTDALSALVRAIETGNIRPEGVQIERAKLLVEEARKGITRPLPWTPFQRARPMEPSLGIIKLHAEREGVTFAEAEAALRVDLARREMYVNSRYQVLVTRNSDGVVYLSIKRIDQQPVRDWRDIQKIKNELVGRECEGVELYPAESRLMDCANSFHVWCSPDPEFRFPFGQSFREVSEARGGGEGQRAFAESAA